jgi:hypothetical protein
VAATSSPAARPTTAAVGGNATSLLTRPIADQSGVHWGWLAVGIAIVVAGVAAGLGGWRRRRRAGAEPS